MAGATIGFGAVLILLGVGAYFGSDRASITAMIPAFFGVIIALCGFAALRPGWRRPGIVAAGIISLLGFFGSLSRILPKLVRGEEVEMGAAAGAQLAMAALTAIFVGVCAWWLIRSRPARTPGGGD